MPFDETIVPGQPGHAATHSAIGARLNELSDENLSATFVAQRPVESAQPQVAVTQAPSGRVILLADGATMFAWSPFGISRSSDGGTGWAARTNPTGTTTDVSGAGRPTMVEHGGYWYLSCHNSSGVPSIYRAAVVPYATALSWSTVLHASANASSQTIGTGLVSNGTTLFWVDYGDPAGGPSLYKSTDGTTWTETDLSGYFSRHAHGVFVDPYDSDHIWITGGDAASTAYHIRSTDGGATWAAAPGDLGTNQAWQSVQVSFSADWIYFGADTSSNWDVFRADRDTMTPRWHGRGSHRHLPVPSGLPSRKITDLVTTSGSGTVTSATAAFTSNDVGSRIRTLGQDRVPIDTYIQSVTNSTTAVCNKGATAAGTSTAILGGEAWGAMSYYGAVDPDTEIYYFVSINGAVGGNVDGLFAVMPDGHTVLLETLNVSPDAAMRIDPVYSRVLIRSFWRPLLAI